MKKLACLIVALLLFTACAKTPAKPTPTQTPAIPPTAPTETPAALPEGYFYPTGALYVNEAADFSFDFPAEWRDKAVYSESGNSLAVCLAKNVLEKPGAPAYVTELFRITAIKNDAAGRAEADELISRSARNAELLQTDKFIYVLRLSNDSPVSFAGAAADEYAELLSGYPFAALTNFRASLKDGAGTVAPSDAAGKPFSVKTASETPKGETYENAEFGFRFAIPEAWRGKLAIQTTRLDGDEKAAVLSVFLGDVRLFSVSVTGKNCGALAAALRRNEKLAESADFDFYFTSYAGFADESYSVLSGRDASGDHLPELGFLPIPGIFSLS